MTITKILHKSDASLNIPKKLSKTAVLDKYTEFLEIINLLEKEKNNKQPLEIQFKTHKQRYLIKLYSVNPKEYSSENLDTVENSGRYLFSLNIEELIYKKDLSKLDQLGYWVQNNLIERPTHFMRTQDLYDYYKKTFNAYDNKILTFDGFSKAIDKTMKMFSFNFTKKRLNGHRGYVGVCVSKRDSHITYKILTLLRIKNSVVSEKVAVNPEETLQVTSLTLL